MCEMIVADLKGTFCFCCFCFGLVVKWCIQL